MSLFRMSTSIFLLVYVVRVASLFTFCPFDTPFTWILSYTYLPAAPLTQESMLSIILSHSSFSRTGVTIRAEYLHLILVVYFYFCCFGGFALISWSLVYSFEGITCIVLFNYSIAFITIYYSITTYRYIIALVGYHYLVVLRIEIEIHMT